MVANSENQNGFGGELREMRRLLRDDDQLLRELLELFPQVYPECVLDVEPSPTAFYRNGVCDTGHHADDLISQIQALHAASMLKQEAGVMGSTDPIVSGKFAQLVRDVAILCDEIRSRLDA